MNTPIPIWTVFAFLAAACALDSLWSWFAGQYEVTCRGRRWLRVTRRWYGPRAHVTVRGERDEHRYAVLAFDGEDRAVPWLKVHKLDPQSVTWLDEDAGPFWAPVTRFAPYSVRRVRPWINSGGRLPVPWLFQYLPLRRPAGYLEDGA